MESFGVPSVSPPPPCSPGSDSSSIGATHHSSPPAAVVEGSYMSRKARAFSIDALLADQSSPASSICEDSDVEVRTSFINTYFLPLYLDISYIFFYIPMDLDFKNKELQPWIFTHK